MAAQREGVPFLDRQRILDGLIRHELSQELKGHGASHHRHVGILLQNGGHGGRMIRLHMVDNEVVRSTALQSLLQVPEPLLSLTGIGRIQDGHFIIHNKVGVVRHTFRHDILTLEQIQIQMIYAYIADSFSNFFHDLVHIFTKIKKNCLTCATKMTGSWTSSTYGTDSAA